MKFRIRCAFPVIDKTGYCSYSHKTLISCTDSRRDYSFRAGISTTYASGAAEARKDLAYDSASLREEKGPTNTR